VPVSFDGPLSPYDGHVVPVANAAATQNVIDLTRAYAHVSPHVFDYFAGCLVGSDAEQPWMAEFAMDRPFDERHLHDNHWPHPVRSHTR
jgi:hypothetical protein